MDDYLKTAHKTISYFFKYQVISNNIEVELKDNFKNYLNLPKNIVGVGKFKTKFIRRDKKEESFYIFLIKNPKKQNLLFIGVSKDFNKANGPLNEGNFFKLYYKQVFTKHIKFKKNTKNRLDKKNSIVNKILNKLKLMPKELIKDRDLKHYFQHYVAALKRKMGGIEDLSKFPGIHWKVEKIIEKKVSLSCFDNGGILDFYLNDELNTLPPQIPSSYYADAYAAYCFCESFLINKKKEYLKATIGALNFIMRTYNEKNPSFFIFYHHDFKNPAFIETVYKLKPYINTKQYEEYVRFIKKLKEGMYNPTNVYALRYHWRSLRSRLYKTNEKEKIKRIIKRIKNDQTKEGLILDNNYNNDYINANDLTYHLYSLACIELGLENNYNKDLFNIFLKGCEFSSNLVTPYGEVSYVGRAANNIYHYASAILVFEFCSNYYKLKNEMKSKKFKDCAKKVFKYLIKWQRKDGFFPTGMNKYIKKRMGWNHCESPYNMLVAYFLIKTSRLCNDKVSKNNGKISLKNKKINNLLIMPDAGYTYYQNKKYYHSFYGGGGKSYPWSGHITGLPGTANLGKIGEGPIYPILDLNISCLNEPSSDMPLIISENKICYLFGRGKLEKIDENILKFKKNTNLFIFIRYFLFLNNSIIIINLLKIKKKCKLKIKGLISIPLWEDLNFKVTKNKEGVYLNDIKKNKIGIRQLFCNIKEKQIFDYGKPRTNPRGLCNVLYINELPLKKYKKNSKIFFVSEITFNKFKDVKIDYNNGECNIKINKSKYTFN